MQTEIFEGGFADPVFTSQAVFRAVMDAFARPGTIANLSDVAQAPAPIPAAAAAILLTLADFDTPVWLEADDSTAASQWLSFHTGAVTTPDAAAASFVMLSEVSNLDSWDRFALGTAEYPDRSATLLLPVAGLDGGQRLTLRGPGIEKIAVIVPRGLPGGFIETMQENARRYPLGFDVVLVCGGQALALPRTVRIEV
ncbi:alpha-D-ribose 1-methylphosphonate 5-triphosphate synthase subunit PhnH [Brucella endophytica]|uniref:Alpha-D-ribose 1-methylphosphonate 5-triphosphate synthase subunit PhnH n=1 Tax=Brucella endophytica TaxID=1963359 RepID=A0A916WKJ9_9HYPH|nr:phosphonate C-P lyase system protein PhnH [Brucella endophytica]GGB06402.1 alpha-D-ribose 1-methylphosphonate 5-triphosphate synthase subunit PhnH [Brucella endophytica]